MDSTTTNEETSRTTNSGGIMLTTPAQINAFRAHTLRVGLESEIRSGMKLTNKAPSCYTIIKRERGFKGSKVRVYAQYVLWMEQQGMLTINPADFATLMGMAN
jgi:hypothetical protein